MSDVDNFREPPSVLKQVFVFLSIAIMTKIALVMVGQFYSEKHMVQIASLSLLSFFGLGKFIIFAPIVPLENHIDLLFNSYELGAMVVYMDVAVAFIVIYNFHMLKKIYGLGRKLENIQKSSYYLLKSSTLMQRFATIGIILFVSFPIAGTGAVGAAFLASLLGMSRIRSIFWIFIGSILGCLGMALGAVYLENRLKIFLENPAFFWSSIAVFFVLIILASLKMKKMITTQRLLEEKEENSKNV